METTSPRGPAQQEQAGPSLAPSEQVLLHGERFAPPDGAFSVGERLLTSDTKVAVGPLAQAAPAAAVLANESAGALHLRTERRSALLGLVKRTVVVAEAGATAPGWPHDTLESRIAEHLEGGALEVQEVLYRALGTDSANASQQTTRVIKEGLLRRGLLEQETKTHLKVVSTSRYRLAPAATPLLAQHSPDATQRLLDTCERERPELWKALCAQIGQAISRRTESSDSSNWSG